MIGFKGLCELSFKLCAVTHNYSNQESIVMKTKTQTTVRSIEKISMITKLLTLTYGDKDGVELVIDVKTFNIGGCR